MAQQQFFNNVGNYAAPTNPNTQGGSQFLQNFNASHPQMNYTVDAFNNANQTDAPLALLMASQGGQQFRNAIMQQNGWNQGQMNNWLNQVQYEGQGQDYSGGMSPGAVQRMQGFGATMAPQQFGAPPGSTGGGNNPIANGPYGALADGGNGAFAQPGQPTTLGALAGNPGAAGGGAGGGAGNPGAVDSFGNPIGGNAPTGMGSIPGTQPNYPLDIGSYLNPMMKYALQQGTDTINNSAASSGNLNSGNTEKELMQFGAGMGAQNFNNAAGIAAAQQQFGYGVDNNDRNFAYNAANNDRNFNMQSLLSEAGLGMGAAGQQGLNARLLATLISSNMGQIGQAQSGGTLGANNSLANAISQIIAGFSGTPSPGGH